MRRPLACLVPVLLLALVSCTPTVRSGPSDPMLAAVNAQRAAAGVAPLASCPSLARAAQGHTNDQAAHDLMSHTGSDGSTFDQRAVRAGYVGWNALGENVAAGYQTIAAVVDGWMHSPGHRANILNRAYTHFGAGNARSDDGTPYWTQDFGRGGRC